MSIISFFKKLRGNYLYEIEEIILQSIRDQLSNDDTLLWDRQIQAINKIQRLPDGVEVDFYRMRNGRPSFDAELAFPNKTEELLLAKVRIELLGKKLDASVLCVNGYLFSIEYAGSINYFEENYGIDPSPNLIIKSKIIADLSTNTTCEVEQSQLPKIKVSFSLEGKFGIVVDLDKITKKMRIKPTETRTPDDWPEAIKNPKTELPDELKPRYIWNFDIGYKRCNLVRDRFDVMLSFLAEKSDIINDLKKQFSLMANFTVGIHAQHDPHNMPEVFLTQEIIAFAASIGADVGFDMYLD